MSTIALIPARAGSKGVPNKNARLLAGKPLLAYAAEAALRSGVVDRAILSTDSEAIAEVGRMAGLEVPFLRPAEIADDAAPMIAVIRHLLNHLETAGTPADVVVLLQPTQPLRRPEHVRDAVRLLRETGADSVVSVTPVPLHMCPDYVMKITEGGELTNFLPEGASVRRRQDVRPAYTRDGTVYCFRAATVLRYGDIYGNRCVPVVIDPVHSINIDTPEDWAEAERRMAR